MDVTQLPEDLGKRIIELARIAAMMHLQTDEEGGGQSSEGADRAPMQIVWPHDRLLDRPMDWQSAGREAA
jgi:hypothetical protein